MYKIICSIIILNFTLALSACSEKTSEVPVKREVKQNDVGRMHSEPTAKEREEKKGLSEAIKNKTLPDYPAMTIGKAFDGYSYFSKREWRETFTENGKIYVDFAGWFDAKFLEPRNIKEGISARGIEIKFVINPDGPFFVGMVSRLETKTDGKIYAFPQSDIKGILANIYANKEISF